LSAIFQSCDAQSRSPPGSGPAISASPPMVINKRYGARWSKNAVVGTSGVSGSGVMWCACDLSRTASCTDDDHGHQLVAQPMGSLSRPHVAAPKILIPTSASGRPAVRDNYNLQSHKYVCITTFQPDTKI